MDGCEKTGLRGGDARSAAHECGSSAGARGAAREIGRAVCGERTGALCIERGREAPAGVRDQDHDHAARDGGARARRGDARHHDNGQRARLLDGRHADLARAGRAADARRDAQGDRGRLGKRLRGRGGGASGRDRGGLCRADERAGAGTRLHGHDLHQRERTGRRRRKDAHDCTRPCTYLMRAAAPPEDSRLHGHLDGQHPRRQIRPREHEQNAAQLQGADRAQDRLSARPGSASPRAPSGTDSALLRS